MNPNDTVTLPNGQSVVLPPMPAFGDRVNAVSGQNSNNEFYWMKNKYGKLVPVNKLNLLDCLKRGFMHTDGKLYSEDLSLQVPSPEPAPETSRVLATLAELMLEERKEKKAKSIEKKDKV